MGYSKTEETVFNLSLPIAEAYGLSLWDVEFKKEGSEYFFLVFLDKEGGVSIDDCESVSRELSDKLDEADPISQAYMLEVCSAGLDRQLKRDSDFEKFIGHDVDVRLYAPIGGRKEFTAELKGYADGIITLLYDGEVVEIHKEKTSSVRLSVKF